MGNLVGCCAGFVQVPLFLHGHPVVAHGDLRKCSDVFRPSQGGLKCSTVFDNRVDKPDRHGLLGFNRTPGQDQLQGTNQPDDARKADGSKVNQQHAKTAVEDAQNGGPADDAQITPQCKLHPAGDRVTLDGCNHGLA